MILPKYFKIFAKFFREFCGIISQKFMILFSRNFTEFKIISSKFVLCEILKMLFRSHPIFDVYCTVINNFDK